MKRKNLLTLLLAFVLVLSASIAEPSNITKVEASYYSAINKQIFFDNSVLHWDEVYVYTWNSETGATKIIQMDQVEPALFEAHLEGSTKYNYGLFKNTSGKNDWDEQTTDFCLPCGPSAYYYFYDNMTSDGKVDGHFTTAYKQVKIYYKNDAYNFSNPHIYYKTSESEWTKGFGFEMKKSTSKPGYYEANVYVPTYSYGSVTCCFNNADGGCFDNNNCKDYYLTWDEPSSYYKEFCIDNGTITKLVDR